MLTRPATPADAELIAQHRAHMFADSGQATLESMTEMSANFVAWVRPRLADERYLGWLVEDGGAVIAGAGMWIMDFPPHWMDPEPSRAYLLNFYVDPAFRGRGLAQTLLDITLAEARRRDIQVVSLHASKFGRPIYERSGFEPTNEMILRAGKG
jgi:ribosomal protein S18 acetylase RimI-like enzyme